VKEFETEQNLEDNNEKLSVFADDVEQVAFEYNESDLLNVDDVNSVVNSDVNEPDSLNVSFDAENTFYKKIEKLSLDDLNEERKLLIEMGIFDEL